jgi:hypothetical protein
VRLLAGFFVLAQMGEVRGGGNYLPRDDFSIHCGLGSSQPVDKVEISCPAGKAETLADVGR